MTKKIDPANLPEFDLAEYLDSEIAISEYLNQTIADGDMAELRPNASPRFETVSKVCAALGVRLVAQPIH